MQAEVMYQFPNQVNLLEKTEMRCPQQGRNVEAKAGETLKTLYTCTLYTLFPLAISNPDYIIFLGDYALHRNEFFL